MKDFLISSCQHVYHCLNHYHTRWLWTYVTQVQIHFPSSPPVSPPPPPLWKLAHNCQHMCNVHTLSIIAHIMYTHTHAYTEPARAIMYEDPQSDVTFKRETQKAAKTVLSSQWLARVEQLGWPNAPKHIRTHAFPRHIQRRGLLGKQSHSLLISPLPKRPVLQERDAVLSRRTRPPALTMALKLDIRWLQYQDRTPERHQSSLV